MSVLHRDLSRLKFQIAIVRVKSRNIERSQVLGKSFRPRVGAGEHDDPIPFLLIFEKVPGEHLKAAVVGTHSLDSRAKARFYIPGSPCKFQHGQGYAATIVQSGNHFVRTFDLRYLVTLFIISLSDPVLNALPEFSLHGLRGIRDVRGLVDENGGGCICTLLRFGNPVHKGTKTTDVIVGGVDQDMRELLDRPLGFRVEGPDRVDLIAEELYSERVLLRERPDIHDVTPHGKVPGEGHLGAPLITVQDQSLLDPVKISLVLEVEGYAGVEE